MIAALLASALTTLGAAAPAAGAELMPPFPDTSDRRLIVSWLVERAGFPAGAPADLGPESAVLIETDSTEGLRAGLHAVRFREEAITTDFVARTGGRSLSGQASVDCINGQVRAGLMTVFHGTGLKGERVAAFPAQETWRKPPAGSLFERVVETVCDAAPAAAAAPVDRESAGLRGESSAAAPPQAPPPLRASTSAGDVTVQVGAFVTRDQASAGLAKVRGLAGAELAGHLTEVASATVNGTQVFRALVHGFATRTEAQAFCTKLTAQGQPCLVRP